MEEEKIMVEETNDENAGAGDILTFDEILQDKYYQSSYPGSSQEADSVPDGQSSLCSLQIHFPQ